MIGKIPKTYLEGLQVFLHPSNALLECKFIAYVSSIAMSHHSVTYVVTFYWRMNIFICIAKFNALLDIKNRLFDCSIC